MSEPFIGIITVTAFDYAPRGWAFCDGTILFTEQNVYLSAVLNYAFGGSESSKRFALPDLRGCATVAAGSGSVSNDLRLSSRTLGEQGGVEAVSLSITQIPMHTHLAYAVGSADQVDPNGHVWGGSDAYPIALYASRKATPTTQLSPRALQSTGSSQAHPNMSPFLVMNYIIAIEGYAWS